MTKFNIYRKFKDIVKQGFLGCHFMGSGVLVLYYIFLIFTLYLQYYLEREE